MASPASDRPNPAPDANLRATITLLGDLAAHAEATLRSVSSFLTSQPDPSSPHVSSVSSNHPSPDPDFCHCPYDRRHRMPPESLFRHSLRCPAAPGGPLIDLGFLEGLRYPGSLKSGAELLGENPFVRPLPESGADLCFSLDKELEGVQWSSFFYKDCPGVVTYPEADVSARTFTLPGFLAVECANFMCNRRERENGVLGREKVFILPSDFWAFRREVEGWKEYPESYSYTAARVASCLREARDCHLGKWIISTSPRFGIVIDNAMKDHIFLLLKFCLKAISREASGSVEVSSGGGGSDLMSLCFDCPRLFQALSWLTSQLSVLYGEMNGKAFTISMVAESLLRVGSSLLMFPLHECGNAEGTHYVRQETSEFKLDADVTNADAKTAAFKDSEYPIGSNKFSTCQVYMSQIAAAVAALHERSLLEDRVKQLRFPQLLSKYQLVHEHSNVSTRATEVRAKRSNYRPILENDGLLWQKRQNQDMWRTKTREELLAEERDYKRRRMSYRGKKVKRTTTQVIRDIIEEHMEEIKQSGGIGYNVKGSADAEVLISGSSFQGSVNIDRDVVKGEESEQSRITSRDSFVSKKSHCADADVTACMPEDAYRMDTYSTSHYLDKVMRVQKYVDHEIQGSERLADMDEHIYLEYGRSYRSHRPLSNMHARQEQDGKEVSRNRYDKRNSVSSHSFKDYTDSSSLSSSSTTKDRYSHASERRHRNKNRNHDLNRLESVREITFEDRYDPYNPHEVPRDDFPRKKCSLTSDVDDYHDP